MGNRGFSRAKCEVLLYCDAVCDVSKCEAAPDWAREINVQHVRRVIYALPEETKLVYVSSDHVFGGDGIYDEDARPCPISVYGRTRVEAAKLVLKRPGSQVIRTGLPIGSVCQWPYRSLGLAALSNSTQPSCDDCPMSIVPWYGPLTWPYV